MIFEVNSPEKGTRKIRVKDYDELTIADWRLLESVEAPEGMTQDEYQRAILCKHTGLTEEEVFRMKPGVFDIAMQAVANTLAEAQVVRVGTPELDPPPTIEHEGITYVVPRDLEEDTIIAQWIDIQALPPGDKYDVMVSTLAILLLPEGATYRGDYADRIDTFERFNLREAFRISAFFLHGSERYRGHTHRLFRKTLMWLLHRSGPGHLLFLSGTAHGH